MGSCTCSLQRVRNPCGKRCSSSEGVSVCVSFGIRVSRPWFLSSFFIAYTQQHRLSLHSIPVQHLHITGHTFVALKSHLRLNMHDHSRTCNFNFFLSASALSYHLPDRVLSSNKVLAHSARDGSRRCPVHCVQCNHATAKVGIPAEADK